MSHTHSVPGTSELVKTTSDVAVSSDKLFNDNVS